MKSIVIFIIAVAGLCCCSRKPGAFPGCQGEHDFNPVASPIYFVGKVKIDNPVVVNCGTIQYVMPENVAAENVFDKGDVFRYMPDSLFHTRYVPLFEPHVAYPKEVESIAEYAVADKYNLRECSADDISKYKFITQPAYFAMLMISETAEERWLQCDNTDSLDNHIIWVKFDTVMTMDGEGSIECKPSSDEILTYTFSDKYIPVVMPVYSRRGLREIWKRNGFL
ncbi:MAG: hypothetical protein NC115_10965 [Bacteroidales bacterium]|nr:hypothetical protein [Bacteroidales bacterium]